MMIDSHLEYVISPKEIEVYDLDKSIKEIVAKMFQFKPKLTSLEIRYKSVIISFGKHRKDSALFHYKMQRILLNNQLLKPSCRTAFLLKKENLKLFKNALYLLDIDCKTRGCAFITHLWAIALKATRARVYKVIKQIWKARMGIKKMSQKNLQQFLEFYSLLQ
ncbi:MAG: hypothetical protein H0U73_05620 [Tatlockia sp.]|nr:hypothetical protein [Tatlockia sp.]